MPGTKVLTLCIGARLEEVGKLMEFSVLCSAPMGIAAADLRQNLADFRPISELRTAGHVRRRLEDLDFALRLDALDRELAELAAGGGTSVGNR